MSNVSTNLKEAEFIDSINSFLYKVAVAVESNADLSCLAPICGSHLREMEHRKTKALMTFLIAKSVGVKDSDLVSFCNCVKDGCECTPSAISLEVPKYATIVDTIYDIVLSQ